MSKFSKKIILIPFLILLLASCVSTSTTTFYDENGKKIKTTNSTVTDFNIAASKNRIIMNDSLKIKLSCSIVDSSTYLPTLELMFLNGKSYYISVTDPKVLPDVVEKAKTVFSIKSNEVNIKN
jgi:PBP1b-binding outer membrane lipoprotein LpoB